VSEAGALLHAILADAIDSETDALLHLEAALELEVEPLAYCANRFNLNDNLVMERAADWAGLAFAPRVPRTRPGSPIIEKLELLGEIRSLRCQLFDDREVIYTAPRFAEFINLRRHIARNPDLSRHICVVPASAIRTELADASQAVLLDEARQRLSRKWPRATGGLDLSIRARSAFVAVVLALVLIAALAPLVAEAAFVPLVGALLALPALLRLWAAIGPRDEPATVPLLDDADLPRYTILLPLRDEARLVPQLSAAIRALDYPPEKLDVRFIVEARSANTIVAVQRQLGDPRFELLAVPDALPRTKPKALNYALPFVIGEHVVVYDAEDIPDPGQLRLAASLFAQRPDLDCLQAELVIDNAGENWLTALFAGEYAGQFGLVLPLLARLGLPMPLGGTSNHFRTSALRHVGGWDPFNVTEDADLGVRLARRGLRTTTFPSRTREEAPVTFDGWLRQRTRWMKGWMQTLIVHNRRPREFLAEVGWRGFLGFQIYVGSMIISAPLHTAFILSFVTSQFLPRGSFDVWDGLSVLIFVIGYGGPVALVIAGLNRLGRGDLLPAQLLLPGYWALHSLATVRALWELISRPFFWAKTQHGRTRFARPVEPP
jgi:cellulose synthase/poly-beta-1,6-N-acetylglucosamine synthase-like glycosyltransferase